MKMKSIHKTPLSKRVKTDAWLFDRTEYRIGEADSMTVDLLKEMVGGGEVFIHRYTEQFICFIPDNKATARLNGRDEALYRVIQKAPQTLGLLRELYDEVQLEGHRSALEKKLEKVHQALFYIDNGYHEGEPAPQF